MSAITTGKVHVACMNLRSIWAPDRSKKINVTSGQLTASRNRRDFSPMTAVTTASKTGGKAKRFTNTFLITEPW